MQSNRSLSPFSFPPEILSLFHRLVPDDHIRALACLIEASNLALRTDFGVKERQSYVTLIDCYLKQLLSIAKDFKVRLRRTIHKCIILICFKRPKFDSALHVPDYIDFLGYLLEYNTSIFEGDIRYSKKIGKEHTNHHRDQVCKTILTKVWRIRTPILFTYSSSDMSLISSMNSTRPLYCQHQNPVCSFFFFFFFVLQFISINRSCVWPCSTLRKTSRLPTIWDETTASITRSSISHHTIVVWSLLWSSWINLSWKFSAGPHEGAANGGQRNISIVHRKFKRVDLWYYLLHLGESCRWYPPCWVSSSTVQEASWPYVDVPNRLVKYGAFFSFPPLLLIYLSQNPAWIHTMKDYYSKREVGKKDYCRKNGWLRHAPRLTDPCKADKANTVVPGR